MWLITPHGFFSIVQKPGDKAKHTLTIRSRVRSDLASLRDSVLPSMGAISESTDTDYRFRASALKSDVAKAVAQMVTNLDYDNFKSEVARKQGTKRAHLYHDVWDVLYRMQGDKTFEAAQKQPAPPVSDKVPSADAYGGVLINNDGEVLLREPSGHFGGYVWTFPKGRPDPGETPEQAALREVFEETGQNAQIVAAIQKVFPGTTSSTAFFLMQPVGTTEPFTSETKSIEWVTEAAARKLIGQTQTSTGRKRDLAVLDAGFAAWRSLK